MKTGKLQQVPSTSGELVAMASYYEFDSALLYSCVALGRFPDYGLALILQ